MTDSLKRKQFALCYSAFVTNGMLALSIGSLLPFIRDAFGLDYAFCGLLVSLHSVGNLCSSFFSGALPLLIGKKKSIMFFQSFFPVSFLLMLLGNYRLVLVFAFFATGIARGAASNYCNAKINSIATGMAWALNCLHASFAVGAFVFPLILMFMTRDESSHWVYACVFLSALGLLTCLFYYLMPEDAENKKHTDEIPASVSGKRFDKRDDDNSAAAFGFFREPLFYICIATLFFYLCAEQGVIGWMITYFKDTGLLKPNLAQVTASILWVMILLGRLTTAFLSTKVKKEDLLPAMGVGIVLFFIVLILSKTTLPIIIGIMGFGFSMAGIYATTVSFAGELIKKYSLAWSFILTTASLGSIIMPTIVGVIAENFGIATGIGSIAIALFIDMICIMVLVRYVRKKTV
ncbi:MFS transporter [Oribacterium sp. C9]|uniref:MFS transporter n=1 Tax=Oribacterium sp. C9 TaxID=1943579 RepID=UPI001FA8BF5A|nr:MFS transporter [Oribacterium sp. C9]